MRTCIIFFMIFLYWHLSSNLPLNPVPSWIYWIIGLLMLFGVCLDLLMLFGVCLNLLEHWEERNRDRGPKRKLQPQPIDYELTWIWFPFGGLVFAGLIILLVG